jgi:hypothetical protein
LNSESSKLLNPRDLPKKKSKFRKPRKSRGELRLKTNASRRRNRRPRLTLSRRRRTPSELPLPS